MYVYFHKLFHFYFYVDCFTRVPVFPCTRTHLSRDVVDNKGTTERSGEMPLLVGGQGAPSRNDLPSGVLSLFVFYCLIFSPVSQLDKKDFFELYFLYLRDRKK